MNERKKNVTTVKCCGEVILFPLPHELIEMSMKTLVETSWKKLTATLHGSSFKTQSVDQIEGM